MITPELLEYIKKAKSLGQSEDQIKVTLVQAGWSSEDIDLAFNQSTAPQPLPQVPRSNKTALVIALSCLALIVVGGISFYAWSSMNSRKQAVPTEQQENPNVPTETGLDNTLEEISISPSSVPSPNSFPVSGGTTKASVKTVLDCGAEDAGCVAKYIDLFEVNLKSCKPSTGTVVIGFEPALGLYRNYIIAGEKNGSCPVTFSFLETSFPETPNVPPEFLGKEMTCKYSKSERTLEQVSSSKNCSGVLYDELKKFFERMEATQ